VTDKIKETTTRLNDVILFAGQPMRRSTVYGLIKDSSIESKRHLVTDAVALEGVKPIDEDALWESVNALIAEGAALKAA